MSEPAATAAHSLDERQQTVSRLVRQAVRFMNHGLAEEVFGRDGRAARLAPQGLTAAQFELLRYIDRHGRPAVGEVAQALGITSAAVTKGVKALADGRDMPLVRRATDGDRRVVRLTTTPAGEKLVAAVNKEYEARLTAILQAMGERAQRDLAAGLTAFLHAAAAEAYEEAPACLRCGTDRQGECLVGREDRDAECWRADNFAEEEQSTNGY